MKHWLDKAKEISSELDEGELILNIYANWLHLFHLYNWKGACHDTSAGIFMAMSDFGLTPELVIGIVQPPSGKVFDHSWVEVKGLVFDVAVGYPNPEGEYVSAPIFASKELEHGSLTPLQFGVTHENGLSEPAFTIANKTLNAYGERCQLWEIMAIFWSLYGIQVDQDDLRRRFGSLRRTVRGSIL